MTDIAATTGAYYQHHHHHHHQPQPTAPNMMASYGTTYVPPPVDQYPYHQHHQQQTSYYAPQLQLQHLEQPHSPPLSAPSLAAAAAAAAAGAAPAAQASQEPDPWQQTPIGTYTVVSTYTPTLDDELYVQLGDRVQVFVEYDDGWCLGANLSANGARGVFPQHCVQQSSPHQPFAQTLTPNDNRYSKRSSSLMNESPVR
ncbi:hypothetical protein BCR43DRAFT_487985 [Syncephalastrum racemosum]|uniref:SH3 domain-containing protein n=1 Tax=Syncephalastrum racemosum TaxID=13706 RepID=A0A1X2HHY0_SYNRA|nr:hypothetical protein BCR43DRAFT_487985 [Syncephalastrum racemosum]